MSLRSDQREDGENTSGSSEAKTDRYGFLLVNGDMNNDSDELSPELVRHREMKWINLMSQWNQVMEKKHSKIKAQCQKGIPASVRCKCWPLLCGATQRKENNKDLYNTLESSPGQQSWIDVIKRDTDRQFPFHEMFQSKDGHGQQGLLQVLKAYTQFRPDEGYCQAQGPVAAVLLMHMPMEEAFWCLVQISELYLPGYYSPLLEGVLFDAAVLFGVLKRTCPAAYKHMQRQGVEPLMFATDWLMCLYSRHLPFNTLLRVWDLFFCNGVRVLFQVAVVLVRRCLGEARQRKECEGQMETLERLRSVKGLVQHEQADVFIQEVCSVPLSLGELQRQTEKELQKWRKERPGSTFDPRDRCQGYYMIWEKGQERVKENEKKERQSKNLKVPVMRSHSSLSPAILRKKWRKRGSKTETEEWEGRGFMKQGSDDEEKRRASVCGVAGELMAKTQKTPPEFSKHLQIECNTTVNRQCTAATETQPDSELSDRNDTVFEEDENDVVVIAVPSHTDNGDHEEERKLPNSMKEDDLLTANSQQEIEKQHDNETWQDEEKKEQTPRDNQDEEISTHRDQQEPESQQEESQPSQLEEVEDPRNKPEQEPQEIKSKQEEETEIKTCNPEEKVQLKINTQEDNVEVQENTDKQEKPEQENGTRSKREGKMRMDSSKNKQEIETNSQEQEGEIHLGSAKEEAIQLGKEKQTISSEEEVEIEEEKEIQTKSSEQEVEIQEEKGIMANREGRGFMKQGSDDEEKRRASVCGVAGELMAKTQKTPPEFSKHLQIECNTTVNRQCTAATETQPDSELSDRNDTVFEEDENDVVVIAVPSHTDNGDHEEERKLPNSMKEDDLLTANSQQEIEKQHDNETWQDEEKKEQTPRDNQDEEISTHRDQQEPESQQEESQPSQLEEVEDPRNKPEQEPQEIKSKQEEETEIKTCNPEEKVQLKINTQEDNVEVQENTDKQEKPEQENGTRSKREGKMRMDSSKNKQEIETNSQEQEGEIHLGSAKEEAIQLGKEKQTISSEEEVEIEEEKEIQTKSSEQEVEIQEEKGIMANSSVQEEKIEKDKEIQANSSEHEVEIEKEKEIHAKSCKQEMEIMEGKGINVNNSEQEVEIENGDKQAHSANEEEKLKICLIHTQDELHQQEDSTQKIEVGQIVEKEEEMHSNVQTPEDQKDAEDRAPSVQEEEGHVKDECCGNGSNTNVENTQQELEGERQNEARISDAPAEETEGNVTDGEKGSSNSLTVDQAESETLVSSPCVQLERVIEHSGESEAPRDSDWTQDENTEVNKMSTPEHVEPDRTSESRNPEPLQPNKKEEEVEIEVNVPSNSNPQLRLRRSSSSHTYYPTILSGDTFRDPQESIKRDSCPQTTEAEESDIVQPTQTQCSKQEDSQKPQTQSQSKSNKPKRRGLFQRLRADTPSKSTIPKIVIQDFSEGEKMSSKERRRRRRMQERKEKEEDKERKKLEKELEKEKGRERKKTHTRGKSFQALSRKHDDDEIFSERSGSPAVGRKRTSFSESYF
ncbi:myb-like protein X [Tachysurus ichikawai]